MEPEGIKHVPGPAIEWMRSPIAPELVFTKAYNRCGMCAFGISNTTANLCGYHPCEDGVWVPEAEAVILRLES
jgi:hypothetical protein